MDLIGSLVSQLGVDRSAAEGAAGTVLSAIRNEAPSAEGQQLVEKVPEAQGWMQAAAAHPSGGAGAGGGILGAAGGILGGLGGGSLGGAGALGSSLGKLGIGPDKLGVIVPLVLQFLTARMGNETVSRLVANIPFLKNLGGGAGGGGLGGALGGLFGK